MCNVEGIQENYPGYRIWVLTIGMGAVRSERNGTAKRMTRSKEATAHPLRKEYVGKTVNAEGRCCYGSSAKYQSNHHYFFVGACIHPTIIVTESIMVYKYPPWCQSSWFWNHWCTIPLADFREADRSSWDSAIAKPIIPRNKPEASYVQHIRTQTYTYDKVR